MYSRRLLIPLGVAVFVAVTPGLAAAAGGWSTNGAGNAAAGAGTITAPTTITLPGSTVTNGSVAVSWSGATVPPGATAAYWVQRKSGVTYSNACGSTQAAPISGNSCTDTSVADGTYKYRVATRLGTQWIAISGDSASSVAVVGAVAASVTTPDLVAVDDTGSSTTDNLTNKQTLTFTGTATTGSTVTLFEGATSLGSAVANATTGVYSVASSFLAEGAHTITATASKSGFTTGASPSSITVTIDVTAPPDPANVQSSAPGGNTARLTWTAVAGISYECKSDVSGFTAFTACASPKNFANNNDFKGTHDYTVRAVDAAGNVSPGVTKTQAV